MFLTFNLHTNDKNISEKEIKEIIKLYSKKPEIIESLEMYSSDQKKKEKYCKYIKKFYESKNYESLPKIGNLKTNR